MNSLKKLTITAIALASTTAAYAADHTGFYIGGGVGYVSADMPYFDTGTDATNVNVFLGYNHVLPSNFMFGAEIAYSMGEVLFDQYDFDLYFDDFVDLKIKAGYQYSASSMAYLFGGSSAAVFSGIGLDDLVTDGTVIGIGHTTLVNEYLTVGLEISKRKYDSLDEIEFEDFYEDTSFTLRAAYQF